VQGPDSAPKYIDGSVVMVVPFTFAPNVCLKSLHNSISLNVFPSVAEAKTTLASARELLLQQDCRPELREAIELVLSKSTSGSSLSKPKFFVVLEGLDGTGKSTMSQALQDRFDLVGYSTPGSFVGSDIRSIFDRCGCEEIRRAFYVVATAAVGQQGVTSEGSKGVVCDRYIYSTIAYAIGAAVVDVTELPEVDNPIWQMPTDMIQPDLVVLLRVTPSLRSQRVIHRGLSLTTEEQQLAQERRFENAVYEAFQRCLQYNGHIVKGVMVDADGKLDQLIDHVSKVVAETMTLPQ